MENSVDEGLIRASQRGDRSAFAQLLELVYGLIYRFAFKWAGCDTDAEDITQQACMKLARVIKQFRFESAFTTWLYRLVINCAKDWLRAQSRHRSVGSSVEFSHGRVGSPERVDSPEQYGTCSSDNTTEAGAELERVLTIVDSMGDGYRESLLLVYAEGLTHREAAEVLSVKESTISWRLHEVKKRLKQHQERAVEEVQK